MFRLTCVAVTLALSVAACGGDDEPTGGTTTPRADGPASTEARTDGAGEAPTADEVRVREVLKIYFTSTDEAARCDVLSPPLAEENGCPATAGGQPVGEGDFEVKSVSYEEGDGLWAAEVIAGEQAGSVGVDERPGGFKIESLYNFRAVSE